MTDLDKLSKNGVFMSDYEQMKYEKCIREDGYADGIAEGLDEGKAVGFAEAKAEIIVKLHQKGMSAQEMSELPDKTVQEIETILSVK